MYVYRPRGYGRARVLGIGPPPGRPMLVMCRGVYVSEKTKYTRKGLSTFLLVFFFCPPPPPGVGLQMPVFLPILWSTPVAGGPVHHL